MGFKDLAKPDSLPKILHFPVENRAPRLSIHIDDADMGLFYREYYSMVYRRCLAVLHNEEDARDAAHEVFAKIQELKSGGRLDVPYPKTYLSAAAKNMSINQKKKARRELNEIYDMATNGSLNWYREKEGHEKEAWEAGIIDTGYERAEAGMIVKAILREQDEMARKIYFYYYRDEMTLKEIGKLLGVSKSTIHNKIKALENQVRQKMGRAGK